MIYPAGAGIQDAEWQLQYGTEVPNNIGQSIQYTTGTVNGYTVSVTILKYNATVYTVTSTAGNETVTSHIQLAKTTGVFAYAVGSLGGDISLSGNVHLQAASGNASVYSAANLTMSGNTSIKGNALAVDSINKSGNASISGTSTPNAQPVTFDTIDTSTYLAEATTLHSGDYSISGNSNISLVSTHITGNLIISGNSVVNMTGVVYVDGYISVSGNAVLNITYPLIAVGNINISGNSSPLINGQYPLIISTSGNITVSGNSSLSALLYAPNGIIDIGGNSLVGAAVGKSVKDSGNGTITYPDLSSQSNLPGGGLGTVVNTDVLDYIER